ncbi:GntR family transcriptional regulator [Amycolatopsis carbonis]|uniref:GntR family transcriptional regulator n=1 Tax=Amycolatopsis carbonis TaxID=715471 RepID=A0A9Y2MP15_9PSEU|nr:GntR family transcriptional regulator [Amycolatopsis sp. 2-15]WIX75475.1 GntR family transcriptional regulator [Amycolatopsis sp. 2-15]
MPETPSRTRAMSLAERAVLALRELVHDGVLLPGQPIRQAAVAQQLGISRVPVREALKNLEAEGLVEPSPSGGFVVARLSADELSQIYLMRRLLETELLRQITSVPESELAELTALNHRMAELIDNPSRELRHLNRDFHFRIFRLSGLTHIVAETARLWDKTTPYRLVYSTERAARVRIVDDHDKLIGALRRGDVEGLIQFMDDHRGTGEQNVVSVLSHPHR